MNRTYFKGIALVAVLAFLLTGTILVQAAPLGQDEGNVYEMIQADDDLSTLAAAIEAAGLGETLSGEGPFTIFAPNNAAFEAIPPAELEALLADAAMLSDVLLLHVVSGNLMAADLAGQSPVSALGDSLEIAGEGEEVTVNGASVVVADMASSNGVVHVIDSVLGVQVAEEEAAAAENTAEPAADDSAATAEDTAEPAAESAAPADDAATSEEVVETGGDETSSEANDSEQTMAPVEEDGEDQNVAERSGRPRCQYMKVWRGVNHPRTLGR